MKRTIDWNQLFRLLFSYLALMCVLVWADDLNLNADLASWAVVATGFLLVATGQLFSVWEDLFSTLFAWLGSKRKQK